MNKTKKALFILAKRMKCDMITIIICHWNKSSGVENRTDIPFFLWNDLRI
jgi:hypothetical protein